MLSTNKLLVVIVIIASLLRFIGLWPNTINADEAYVQTHSWDIVNNLITRHDPNPHTFKYGSLMFYLQALPAAPVFISTYLTNVIHAEVATTITSKDTDFNLFYNEANRKYSNFLVTLGRGETALFGVASVLILYFIAKKLFNKRVGLIASFLFAIAPLHVRDSHYITTDVLSLFSILVAILCLIYLFETKKWKWFILSGLALGISATIRYFPLAMLIYPVALLYSFEAKRSWYLKALTSFLFIFVGVFLGIPYFFIDPNGPALFMQDMQKYVLPWYSTSISSYFFSVVTSIVSHGKTTMPDIKMLYTAPKTIRPVQASWLFFNGIGILPTIFGLIGALFLFFKSIKKFLFLAIIPIFNFIYISAFIPSTYERLVIPLIPFMVIFAGVFIDYLFQKKAGIALVLFIFFVSVMPFMKSATASIACGEDSIQTQSVNWILKHNIPQTAKIGYLTMVSTPPVNYAAWTALEPGHELSLKEAQDKGLNFAFLNTGRLDYNTYTYFNDFFIVPDKLYENSYYSLIFSEYQSRSELLGKVQKPWMCDFSRIYYYKLPEKIKDASSNLMSFNFENATDGDFWKVKSFDKTGNASITKENKIGYRSTNSLNYSQSAFGYTPPRITSKEIKVDGNKIYTFSFWARSKSNDIKNMPVIIGRVDFYQTPQKDSTSKLRNALLLSYEGSTPFFFEKKRFVNKKYFDTDLPGESVALSAPFKLIDKWQKVLVSATSPSDVNFATVSIQPISADPTSLYIDSINLLD